MMSEFLDLEVWYNTTSTSSLHRITVNASFPITCPAYSYVSTVNQSLTITPSKYACDSCILSISPNLPDGLEFNLSNSVISAYSNSVSFAKITKYMQLIIQVNQNLI